MANRFGCGAGRAEHNTAQLWDTVWAGGGSVEADLRALRKEERRTRWRRLERIVLERFGRFDGLDVIEIGAGTGTYAALMAARGARVTLLDYSAGALDRASRLFARGGWQANLLQQDALDLPTAMHGQYDISMSFGLAEHFLGDERLAILAGHWKLLRAGGLAFVSVPNRSNPPYRLFKFVAERSGAWRAGEEYPFSRAELRQVCARLGVQDYEIFGESIFRSAKFLNPLKMFPRRKRKKNAKSLSPNPSTPAPLPASGARGEGVRTGWRPQPQAPDSGRTQVPGRVRRFRGDWGTPLDAYLSYAIVLCMKAKSPAK